jgi:DNA invertase Pin-like site-specific DNA recombinase
MMKGFQEVLIKMGADVYQLADDLTGGEFSKLKEAKESLERAKESLERANVAQEGKIKSQEGTIKSQGQEIEDLKTAKAVLTMRTRNMSPEEIALKLDLRLSEVRRILED